MLFNTKAAREQGIWLMSKILVASTFTVAGIVTRLDRSLQHGGIMQLNRGDC